jgi:hypothetical protein
MVPHLAIRMDDPVEALADMAQHLQPHLPILIV